MTASTEQRIIHNFLSGRIVKSIVRTPLDAGGGKTEVLVLLESVILGVILAIAKLDDAEIVLDIVVEGVKERLAEIRLKDINTVGEA